MHFTTRNVNTAFNYLVTSIHAKSIATIDMPSRYGRVLTIREPVIISTTSPRERVLTNRARDCNPFFHLYEGLWMLAGKNEVRPLTYYNKRMEEFSDNGENFWGAYGYRWRHWFGLDQIKTIIYELRSDKFSRRTVMGMWDPSKDIYKAREGGKDVPCNTQIMFRIVTTGHEDQLDMTVINRSNDLVWGMLGANYVHMSMLHEFMANALDCYIGEYNQMSNNLHVYTNNWEPKKWMEAKSNPYCDGKVAPYRRRMCKNDPFEFLDEVEKFVEANFNNENTGYAWKEPFLNEVAQPMCDAFAFHKRREYDLAELRCNAIDSTDWREACKQWIKTRRYNYDKSL